MFVLVVGKCRFGSGRAQTVVVVIPMMLLDDEPVRTAVAARRGVEAIVRDAPVRLFGGFGPVACCERAPS
jgi:hypothetical protein